MRYYSGTRFAKASFQIPRTGHLRAVGGREDHSPQRANVHVDPG